MSNIDNIRLAAAQLVSGRRAALAASPPGFTPAAQARLQIREVDEPTLFSDHLLRLSPADRYQRFGMCVTDEGIGAYVNENKRGLRFVYGAMEQDAVRGAVEARQSADTPRQLEIGVTIECAWRGVGYGAELVLRALDAAHLAGFTSVIAVISRTNRDMIAIARKLGAQIDSLHDCVLAEWHPTLRQDIDPDRASLRREPVSHQRTAVLAL